MASFFHCGFDSHLSFDSAEGGDSSCHKLCIRALDELKLDPKYGGKIKKAFIGWCTVFVVTESGHLLFISKSVFSKTSVIECNLTKSWDLKLLECGTRDIYLVLSDRVIRRWQSENFKLEPKIVDPLVQSGVKVSEISVGSTFVCVLLEDGSVKGMDEEESPVNFDPISGDRFINVSCGHEHILLLTESGKIYSYGRGSKGQLGHENLDDCFEQQKEIEALSGLKIMAISAGGWHSLALSEFGDVYAFGWNEHGQLGIGTDEMIKAIPTLINIENINFISIGCGSRHSMAASKDGNLYAFGWNKYGQLGIPPDDQNNQRTPLKIDFNRKVVSVDCKYWSSLIEAI
ncbi:nucleoside diphosphate kinase isoform X1 [Brevipalpus obovatus]|uniref:nucleoside diphosphate kinase isoform X1 n=1 Tax=Brevipalpus obovatus TaxID=246614 RepID=UPI003D9F4A56